MAYDPDTPDGRTSGDELWAWQVLDDGEWGIIAAIVPAISPAPMPLVFRSRRIAESPEITAVAQAHARASGHTIRFAHFERV